MDGGLGNPELLGRGADGSFFCNQIRGDVAGTLFDVFPHSITSLLLRCGICICPGGECYAVFCDIARVI